MIARKNVLRLAGVTLVVFAGAGAFTACSGDDTSNNAGPTVNPFDASSTGSASGSSSGSSGSSTGTSTSGSGSTSGTSTGATTGSTSGSTTGSTTGSSSGSGSGDAGPCTADGAADAACNSCATIGGSNTHNTCSPYTTNCIPFMGTVPSHPTL